jgi:hypothetical protein
VLTEEIRRRGFVRPVIQSYQHLACGAVTSMSDAIAETYAAMPHFYGSTYCVACRMHRPVGADGEFIWVSPEHITWEPDGEMESSEDSITGNRLKVGT